MNGVSTTSTPPDLTSINFELPGIANLLATRELRVPVFQRSYSWRSEEQVADFWSDIERAFSASGEYFLGTVVLAVEDATGRRTVIDGQQRLATTSLLLAAIRDELRDRGNNKAEIVERDYLAKETLQSEGKDPRLILNTDDDPYFRQIVVGEAVGTPSSRVPSQKLLHDAYIALRTKIKSAADAAGVGAVDRLLDWVRFLQGRIRIGVIEVPTESEAYVIFETLNDRGADLTTADLLKNYLYGRARSHLDAVRDRWMRALGALELTAADAKFTAFLRHYWSSLDGLTREKDLYKAIKARLDSSAKILEFSNNLVDAANYYAAITNPQHEYWTDLAPAARRNIDLLAQFNLAPNRPLLLAAMDKFPPAELEKLLLALVSWSVRGMIVDTMNSGSTEQRYCAAAVKIRAGSITTTDQIRIELAGAIPSDTEFRDGFAIAQVKKSAIARYYLATLERARSRTQEPELVPNEDETQVNLEHVFPRNANLADWRAFHRDDADTWVYRIGNMVLLKKSENRRIGNKPFSFKQPILASSSLELTKEVGAARRWTASEIQERQLELANIAISSWPR